MMKPNETAGAAMMLFTFAKNRLFIKSFLSILMLLMLFCTPDALKANASFDTSHNKLDVYKRQRCNGSIPPTSSCGSSSCAAC